MTIKILKPTKIIHKETKETYQCESLLVRVNPTSYHRPGIVQVQKKSQSTLQLPCLLTLQRHKGFYLLLSLFFNLTLTPLRRVQINGIWEQTYGVFFFFFFSIVTSKCMYICVCVCARVCGCVRIYACMYEYKYLKFDFSFFFYFIPILKLKQLMSKSLIKKSEQFEWANDIYLFLLCMTPILSIKVIESFKWRN